ncbi:MAG: DUF2490 domain-containing protein [Bacteroidetes bacterium]|nr:DUF2490 domain-containing protein [Bacteroidota bacterium]
MKKNIVFFLLFSSLTLFSQNSLKHSNSLWFSDFTKVNFKKNWSFYFDFGLRGSDWAGKWSQQLVRPGLSYVFNEKVNITAGIAYFKHFSTGSYREEFRGWEQLLITNAVKRIKINHRLRIEQRSMQNTIEGQRSNSFTNRYRYMLQLQMPLNHASLNDRTWYIALSDEVMFNSGEGIVYNSFDQNRASIGIGYKWNETLSVMLSYTDIFLVKNRKDSFEQTNVINLSLFHNLHIGGKSQ